MGIQKSISVITIAMIAGVLLYKGLIKNPTSVFLDHNLPACNSFVDVSFPTEHPGSFGFESEEHHIWVRGNSYPTEVNGLLYYPVPLNEAAPAPLVLIAHAAGGETDIAYKGFKSFQRNLARHGIISLSYKHKSPNWVNAIHVIDYLKSSFSGGRIDFNKVGILGHSKGGGQVIDLLDEAKINSTISLNAVLFLSTESLEIRNGVPTMSILPASEELGSEETHDGWVGVRGFPDLLDLKPFDNNPASPYKLQIYVHGADHYGWNSNQERDSFSPSWTAEDGTQVQVLDNNQHYKILNHYGILFFKYFLMGFKSGVNEKDQLLSKSGLISYLNGNKKDNFLESNIRLTWQNDFAITIDDFEFDESLNQEENLRINKLGGRVEFNKGVSETIKSEYWVPSSNKALLFEEKPCWWGKCFPQYKSEIPDKENLRDWRKMDAVLIRVAEVYQQNSDGSWPPWNSYPMVFRLGLKSEDGDEFWISSSRVGGVGRPYNRHDNFPYRFMETLRFPLECFSGIEGQLDKIEYVMLEPRLPPGRKILFDDIQVQ